MTSKLELALTEAYQRESRRIRLRGMAAVLAVWNSLRSHDEDQVEVFEGRSTPLLRALQIASAAVASGYLVRIADIEPPDLSDLTFDQDFRGPFIGVWAELKRTGNLNEALKIGATRAEGLAKERSIQTERATARRAKEIVGWRRVPHGATCSWCIHVSTGRYRTAESASFGHGHYGVDYCDCSIVPIVGKTDPGRVINERLLEQFKQTQQQENPPAYFNADGRTLAPAERPS